MTPPVTISERVADFLDEEGNMVQVPGLVGEIDATEELGCVICFWIDNDAPNADWPQRRKMMELMVTEGCLRELERERERQRK